MQDAILGIGLLLLFALALLLLAVCYIGNAIRFSLDLLLDRLIEVRRLSQKRVNRLQSLVKLESERPPSSTHLVRIEPDGEVKFLHDDKLTAALEPEKGEITIRRASHVEFGPDLSPKAKACLVKRGTVALDHWYVDLHPSGFQNVLGPFRTRDQALKTEVDFFIKNGFRPDQPKDRHDVEV